MLWRSVILAILAWINVLYWFDEDFERRLHSQSQGCSTPHIFLFSKQQLNSPVITFCKIVAVSYASLMAVTLAAFGIQLAIYAVIFLSRDARITAEPDANQLIQPPFDRSTHSWNRITGRSRAWLFVHRSLVFNVAGLAGYQ